MRRVLERGLTQEAEQQPGSSEQGGPPASPGRTWLHVPTQSQPRLSCLTTLAREEASAPLPGPEAKRGPV